MNSDELNRIGIDYAKNILPNIIRKKAEERIEWHKKRGDDVCVVSASLNVYLYPWTELHSIKCICSILESRSGVFTGSLVNGDCSRQEKVNRIKEKFDLKKYNSIYAYGDTFEDREMLGIADERYLRWKKVD